MDVITKSTVDEKSVIITSLTRLALTVYNITPTIIIFTMLSALASRYIIYTLLPHNAGLWLVSTNITANSENLSLLQSLSLTLLMLLQYPFIAFIIRRASVIYKMNTESIKQSCYFILRKLFIILFAMLLYIVMVLAAMMVFILPGLYLIIKFSMAIPAIAIENKGIINSFKHSFKITNRSFVYTFLTLSLCTAVPSTIFMGLWEKIHAISANIIFNEIVISSFYAISIAIFICGIVFLYKELSLRFVEDTSANSEDS